ncbi:MAG: hypothetical protein ABJM06_11590 [Gilvibacter sp.]
MANSKGNKYPLWTITPDGVVNAIDAMGKATKMSEPNFATDIGISDDGTVWITSTQPDADGGGQKIYYSDGDSNWNEINTAAPGGFVIAGAGKDGCVYLTNQYDLYAIDTKATSKNDALKLDANVFDINCGGGYFWALKPAKEGEAAVLQFCKATTPLKWQVFEGNLMPSSISVTASGTCFALLDDLPFEFDLDGKTKKQVIPGSTQTAIQISYKNYSNVIMALEPTIKGNQLMIYTASPTVNPFYNKLDGLFASGIATTYYVPE